MRAQAAHHWAQDELEGPASTSARCRASAWGSSASARSASRSRSSPRRSASACPAIRRRAGPTPRSDGRRRGLAAGSACSTCSRDSDVVVLAAAAHAGDQAADRRAPSSTAMKRGALARQHRARQAARRRGGGRRRLRDGRLGGAALDVFTRGAARRRRVRTGICRTSSSRRTRRARCRTTGRRSSRCSPRTCADSNKASRCVNVVDKVAGY